MAVGVTLSALTAWVMFDRAGGTDGQDTAANPPGPHAEVSGVEGTVTDRYPSDGTPRDMPTNSEEPSTASRASGPKPTLRIPESGSGGFRIAPGANGPSNAQTYQVEVEGGLPFHVAEFARTVDLTLADPRGWSAESRNRLARVDAGGDIRVLLASPVTADRLCAPLDTEGRLSCRNGANVVINAWRWVNGGPGYDNNISDYRRYVINHEVGHALGYPHVGCPRPGALAPVMLQQTLGLEGCRPNAWPARVDLKGG